MKMQLLVDAEEFWPAARADIAAAREHVYVQALTLEADAAGGALAGALLDSPAPDRRVLVDCHSWHVVSDKLRYHPKHMFDSALRAEVRATREMVRGFEKAGIGFQYVNPAGPFLRRAPMRNHKKLVAVDGRVAYIGGINFGDHNFAWHDFMVRIEDPDLATFLSEDFRWTWGGHDHGTSRRFPGLELHVLNGRWNEQQFAVVLDLIATARERIYVQSPYLAPPFSDELARASRRGVHVQIVTPAVNNWRPWQDHILSKAASAPLELRYYTGRMTHMKAMLIDGHTLVMGSANFELWSYHFQQEYLALVTDPALLAAFEERVVRADAARTVPCTETVGRWRGRWATFSFDMMERAAMRVWGARDAEPMAPPEPAAAFDVVL